MNLGSPWTQPAGALLQVGSLRPERQSGFILSLIAFCSDAHELNLEPRGCSPTVTGCRSSFCEDAPEPNVRTPRRSVRGNNKNLKKNNLANYVLDETCSVNAERCASFLIFAENSLNGLRAKSSKKLVKIVKQQLKDKTSKMASI